MEVYAYTPVIYEVIFLMDIVCYTSEHWTGELYI